MPTIIYPQLDGVKVNEDRTLPVSVVQAIRKAYDYITDINGQLLLLEGEGVTPGQPPIPPEEAGAAPNILTATAGLYFTPIGTAPQFGFQGQITLPTTSPNYSHLKRIDVVAISPAGQGQLIASLNAPFVGSTVPYKALVGPQPTVTETWKLQFVCFNEDNVPTDHPFTISPLTVYPASVQSVVGVEVPPRHTDEINWLHMNVGITPTFFNNQVPQVFTYWISSDNGANYVGIGAAPINTVGQQILVDRLAPEVTEQWKVAACVGNIADQGGVSFPAANLPPGTVISPSFTVLGKVMTSISAREIGPRYQDSKQGLHTIVGITPVLASPVYPQEVTLWLDMGRGKDIWQGFFTVERTGQEFVIGEGMWVTAGNRRTNRFGIKLFDDDAGTIWVPTNPAEGTWVVKGATGHVNDGVDADAEGAVSASFSVPPVGACLANGVTDCVFLTNPQTGAPITYFSYNPGQWAWMYYCIHWTTPALSFDNAFWFSFLTVQKGYTQTATGTVTGGTTLTTTVVTFSAGQIGCDIHVAGVLTTIAAYVSPTQVTLSSVQPNGSGKSIEIWNLAPDTEGVNEDKDKHYLGRKFCSSPQLQNPSAVTYGEVIDSFGADPANWTIPMSKNKDGSPYVYREFRFRLYNTSRLGTDPTGPGGTGTYTLQNVAWSGADHATLIPVSPDFILDLTQTNPTTIGGPLSGGAGAPITVSPGAITGAYIGDDAILAQHMHEDSITAANKALAVNAVVDSNIGDVGINKVTYGTSVFWDVVISRGISKPVVVIQNTGMFLFGEANASDGLAGLTSKPYVAIQSGGISLFSGSLNSVTVTSSAITFWSKNGDTTFPYSTLSTNGMVISNGQGSSTAIGVAGISLLDSTPPGAYLNIGAQGVFAARGVGTSNTSQSLPASGSRTFTTQAGLGYVVGAGVRAVGPNGDGWMEGTVTAYSGNSLTLNITASTNQIVTYSSWTLSGNSMLLNSQGLLFTQVNGAKLVMDANGLAISKGTSSVTVTAGKVTIINGDFGTSSPDYAIDIDNTVGMKVTSAANGSFFQTHAVSNFAGGGVVAGVSDSTGSYGVNIRTVINSVPSGTYGELELNGTGTLAGSNPQAVGATVRIFAGKKAGGTTPSTTAGYIHAQVDGVDVRIPYF